MNNQPSQTPEDDKYSLDRYLKNEHIQIEATCEQLEAKYRELKKSRQVKGLTDKDAR